MLKEIMNIIRRDGYMSRSKIARELQLSEAMVDEGIEQLIHMGYLVREKTGETCSIACAQCPYAQNCGKTIVTTFKISDKGHTLG